MRVLNRKRESPDLGGVGGGSHVALQETSSLDPPASLGSVLTRRYRPGRTGNMLGLRLHGYKVVAPLGAGAMGTVWLALNDSTGQQAAIKFLRPELMQDEGAIALFVNEARATNAIRHPNVVDILNAGVLQFDGAPYLMMEFLRGESLCRRLQRSRPLPVHAAVDIACQIASALAAAHRLQIVHQDLKPDNLHLVPDNAMAEHVRVKVLDFGIAKLCGSMSDSSARTRTGVLLGTPQYMSPEQCLGISGTIDHRTDIYALGTILYEMLCGQVPFVSEGIGEILICQVFEEPPPLRALVPAIPKSLESVVLRALAKKPEERFASMLDFAQAVHEAAVPEVGRTAAVA